MVKYALSLMKTYKSAAIRMIMNPKHRNHKENNANVHNDQNA